MELYRECFGQGTPVMLIHGALSDHTFFSDVARNISNHCKVILYDRRGYGENPFIVGMDYSLQTQAKDAYQVLKFFTAEPVCVVGHSVGAHIALELAIQHPHIVKRLVLVEPSLAFHSEDAQILAHWRSELTSLAKSKQILRIFSSFQQLTGAKRNERTSFTPKTQPIQLDRMRKNLQTFVYGDLQEMDSFVPLETQLRQLDVPIIMAVTQHNLDNAFFNTAIHDGAYFGWPVVSFPGTHSSIKEHAEAFSKKLIDVLQL